MEERHRDFAGTIPENYERYFVPLIFAEYAEMLAEKEERGDGINILETACGTGVVTRSIAKRMDAGSRAVATDFNEPMLEEAMKALGPSDAVDFKQADAMYLPFEDETFDAVVCQFGVMFFPDRRTAYREAARVLKDGGKFHFNVWDSLEHNHFAQTVHNAGLEMYPEDPPKFFELPYGYYDIRLIVAELQESGFSDIDISVRPLTTAAKSARHLAKAYCAGSPFANEVAARNTHSLDEAVDKFETAILKEYGDGPISAKMQAFQISAQLA
jgi:SAM-dependent methyltransferase